MVLGLQAIRRFWFGPCADAQPRRLWRKRKQAGERRGGKYGLWRPGCGRFSEHHGRAARDRWPQQRWGRRRHDGADWGNIVRRRGRWGFTERRRAERRRAERRRAERRRAERRRCCWSSNEWSIRLGW